MAELGALLRRSRLRHLSLRVSGLRVSGIDAPALESLTLHLEGEGAADLVEAVAAAELPRLQHLDVDVLGDPEAAARVLAAAVHLPRLRTLTLRCGEEPVDALVRRLAACASVRAPFLEQLVLDGAPVSPDAMGALVRAADRLGGVGILVVTAWTLPDDVRAAATAALPQLVLD
jgi:hypothetical protein